MGHQVEVSRKEVEEWLQVHGRYERWQGPNSLHQKYFEVSAKEGTNVEAMFEAVGQIHLSYSIEQEPYPITADETLLLLPHSPNTPCCGCVLI